MKNTTAKVYVAMSGGVDSSVSAVLLKRAGFEVVGVYMKQWSPEVLGQACMWKQDRQDAMLACAKIGIPFLTWDFSKEYEKEVGKYMIDSYKKGITPNPDVMCNKVIKFGLFFNKAIKEGADYIATGHYAIVKKGKIFIAKDTNKDQTYFLYGINKKIINKIMFPVGSHIKPEVRAMAKEFGLQNAQKKDSQGVCFIGQFDMRNFLKNYIKPRSGKILDLKNKEIGTHDGVYYYTLGQRHGLDIKNGKGPYYVVKKDIGKNIIYVGKENDLFVKKAKVIKINWISKPENFPVIVNVRTRYRAPLKKCKLDNKGNLIFYKPDRATTPGQSAVFYKGRELLGGGIIC